MKIKKFKIQHVVSKMFAIAVVMMMGVAFTACSSNEDPKPNPDAVKYVDLGLPSGTKWAACNLGATKPEEYGDLYAWGETKTKEKYDWTTYTLCEGSENSLTKYCVDSDFGYNDLIDGMKVLEAEDDVATVKLGAPWHMPSPDDIQELIDNCNWEWTELNGVKGYKVTSRSNNKFIFLPAAGFRAGSIHLSVGTFGAYWSNNSSNNKASGLVSYAGEYNLTHFYDRCEGKSVRAVRK